MNTKPRKKKKSQRPSAAVAQKATTKPGGYFTPLKPIKIKEIKSVCVLLGNNSATLSFNDDQSFPFTEEDFKKQVHLIQIVPEKKFLMSKNKLKDLSTRVPLLRPGYNVYFDEAGIEVQDSEDQPPVSKSGLYFIDWDVINYFKELAAAKVKVEVMIVTEDNCYREGGFSTDIGGYSYLTTFNECDFEVIGSD